MLVDFKSHCVIKYMPESYCVLQIWQGYAGSLNFRASIEKTIAFAQTEEVHAIISDTREQKEVATEDVRWLAEVGNPQLLEVGIRKLAFIVPKDQFTRMGQTDYAARSKDEMAVRWFVNLEEAHAWIQEAAE